MGKNYYLCRGENIHNFKNACLLEIFNDMKSLESIDMWTSQFINYDELKRELLKKGLIRSNQEVCIGTYKTNTETKVKRLIPIFQRTLIFKSDLDSLGFTGKSYKELANELMQYIKNNFNNMQLMSYIILQYVEKYYNSKNKVKAPIYESGDISILERIIHSSEKTLRDEKEYSISFKNFLNYEVFKCEQVFSEIAFDGEDFETVKLFKPKNNEINIKGLHDLLCHVIEFNRSKSYNAVIDNNCYEQLLIDEFEHEEFLENRDFERPLEEYAKQVGLDLSDNDALEQDDYAQSFLLNQNQLVKKLDGME